ncbi:MAG: MarR family transcriptional regulator [Chitinivibrionales bacterium]|nr:MarR family transcriptional regulator [Chitinivibrionales bacterium]MBD3358089.1 MarR family transcriptional regulator [Chitinivibrionales bacterium]
MMRNLGEYSGERERLVFEVSEQFLRLVNKFAAVHGQPRDFGIGEKLYPSEIHMLDVMGENPDYGVTELAGIIGVTKGAVSQTVSRLESKKLLAKYRDPRDDRTVLFKLTEKGRIACRGHREFHHWLNHSILKRIKGITNRRIMEYLETNRIIEEFVDEMIGGE